MSALIGQTLNQLFICYSSNVSFDEKDRKEVAAGRNLYRLKLSNPVMLKGLCKFHVSSCLQLRLCTYNWHQIFYSSFDDS